MEIKNSVFFNGIKSDLKNIICGVPQGSILSPLLFTSLYINDLTNTPSLLDFVLFCWWHNNLFSSDDICSETRKISKELSEISNWLRTNKPSVYASKTNHMLMGTPRMTWMNNTGKDESENLSHYSGWYKIGKSEQNKVPRCDHW